VPSGNACARLRLAAAVNPADRAEELREKYGVELGQLWQVGKHRILCGDSTKKEDVERLMGGENAVLLHADPPYGMGKENDGVLNDNLYREKNDAFQMSWWMVCREFVADNGSVYIWGNPEDLWRLWYQGGLNDSERLFFRNEIVWVNPNPMGVSSEAYRCYATTTERCLFFIRGEQGFNNNADNYWEEWEPIRTYLNGERIKMGWTINEASVIAGTLEMGKHWFTKSQFEFLTKDRYLQLQQAANGAAFKREYDDLKREYDDLKREYDDLKREFYKSRAFFDNTHDNMAEVWFNDRVTGVERWGHPTPKPLPLIERIVKSSADKTQLVLDPFLGSGTTLVACENTGRIGRGMELSEAYVAVCLERLAAMGLQPERL
jgi:DNA modification methylase